MNEIEKQEKSEVKEWTKMKICIKFIHVTYLS